MSHLGPLIFAFPRGAGEGPLGFEGCLCVEDMLEAWGTLENKGPLQVALLHIFSSVIGAGCETKVKDVRVCREVSRSLWLAL